MEAPRDFVVARVAAARVVAQNLLDGCDAITDAFIDPSSNEEDDRAAMIEVLLEDAGIFSRAIECAQAVYEEMSDEERSEGEPDYDAIIDDQGDEDEPGEDS
jgi:hypothetical protein